MKIASLLCAAGLLLTAGCSMWNSQPAEPSGPLDNTVVVDNLSATLNVDKVHASVGESFAVSLTVRNTGQEPIRINAPTGAKMLVTVWRYTPIGWERVKQYPESVIQVVSPWTLEPGQTRTFEMIVPVTPDWPQLESLRLTAEPNGRMDVRPAVMVDVAPQ